MVYQGRIPEWISLIFRRTAQPPVTALLPGSVFPAKSRAHGVCIRACRHLADWSRILDIGRKPVIEVSHFLHGRNINIIIRIVFRFPCTALVCISCIIHLLAHNCFPLCTVKCRAVKFPVQPFSQGTVRPCDRRSHLMIALAVQPGISQYLKRFPVICQHAPADALPFKIPVLAVSKLRVIICICFAYPAVFHAVCPGIPVAVIGSSRNRRRQLRACDLGLRITAKKYICINQLFSILAVLRPLRQLCACIGRHCPNLPAACTCHVPSRHSKTKQQSCQQASRS